MIVNLHRAAGLGVGFLRRDTPLKGSLCSAHSRAIKVKSGWVPRSASKCCRCLTGRSSAQLRRVPLGAPVLAGTAHRELSREARSAQRREASASASVAVDTPEGLGAASVFFELCVGSSVHVRESRKYTYSPSQPHTRTSGGKRKRGDHSLFGRSVFAWEVGPNFRRQWVRAYLWTPY